MLLNRIFDQIKAKNVEVQKKFDLQHYEGNLPQIPIIDFDNYEENYEEKQLEKYDYMRYMAKNSWLEDVTLKQVMNQNKEDITGYVMLKDQKDIGGMAWGQVFTKMRDPNFDRQAFFSKLSVKEGNLMLEQMKKEFKNMAAIQKSGAKRNALKAEKFKQKETYPMVMTYYEAQGILVFAMVSKEI